MPRHNARYDCLQVYSSGLQPYRATPPYHPACPVRQPDPVINCGLLEATGIRLHAEEVHILGASLPGAFTLRCDPQTASLQYQEFLTIDIECALAPLAFDNILRHDKRFDIVDTLEDDLCLLDLPLSVETDSHCFTTILGDHFSDFFGFKNRIIADGEDPVAEAEFAVC